METSELFASKSRKDTRRLLREYGENLKRRRKERGITTIEFAEKTGVSREDVENSELGLADLTAPQKKRIEKFLRRQRII